MRTKIYFGMFIVFAVVASCWAAKNFQGEDKIRIVFGGGFGGGLNPTSFKTIHGAYVSDLVFPPLIGTLDIKQYFPRIVKSWEENEADTFLSFTLDPEVAFSNGDPLTCLDIKNSIENSLGIRKKTNEVIDDFKLLNGYQENSDKISGIKCRNSLKIEFYSYKRNPNLLEALNHTDMGIYKMIHNSYIGCGSYIIEQHSKDYVLLKTKLAGNLSQFIEYVGSDTFGTNDADVYVAYSPNLVPKRFKKFKKFELTWMAMILHLYRHEHSLFAQEPNRKALLALLRGKESFHSLLANLGSSSVIPDPQPILKMQLGRLEDRVADNIIYSGTKNIPNLIAESKTKPLRFVHAGSKNCIKLLEHLKTLGFSVNTDRSRELSFTELDFEPADIQCVSYSAALVRKNIIRYSTGDALSPPFEDLLSEQKGSNNMSKNELRGYLQNINKVTLEKVPFIKVGHTPVVAYYNEKKIGIRQITNSSRANSLLDRFYIK